jgi:hypothetical protein
MAIRSRSLRASSLIFAVASWGLAGCGSGDETARYKLVPVNGTVTLNGKPLEGAEVTFTPDDSNPASTPGGDITGPEGNYKAMFRGRTGLASGKYTVKVRKIILPPGMASGGGEDEDPAMRQVATESFAAVRGTAAVVPTEVKGEFDREVTAEGGVPVDFDVKGKPKPITAN